MQVSNMYTNPVLYTENTVWGQHFAEWKAIGTDCQEPGNDP